MPTRLMVMLVMLCGTATVLAQPRKKEAFEVAVDNGLEYLARSQNPDGSWNSGRAFAGGAGGTREPAVSALSVMAFLSAGHVPGEGKYGTVIEKGVRYVCSQQQQNGIIAASQFGITQMYSHGICTLMIAEVIGLMPDRREAANLRKQLVLAVQLLRKAQCQIGDNTGGWRYTPDGRDADISVTGWQVMALRAAKNVGCDVPPETIEKAVGYVKRCYDPQTGGYRYTRTGQVTVPCTGASILSLELCGKEYHRSPESLNAAQYMTKRENILSQNRPHFFYGIYYTSQAMFQIGEAYWKWYRQVLHALLLAPDQCPQQPGGHWYSRSNDDQMAGPNYCTAMAILALTVEYRFLPIYQRGEEPEERDGK
jgi:hypothetical protein